ncbi:MAG: sigma-70 family RNA polymerase sigma factor [Firmicutes bacterium]|nr:sigma-70 family RNA polymerase sigma factor [Bacillota bacterium]
MPIEEKIIVVRQFINYLKKTLKGVQSSYYKKEYQRIENENKLVAEMNSFGCVHLGMYESLFGTEYISVEIRELLDKLPKRQKMVIVMSVVENYTEREIAQYLNISQPRVNQAKMSGFKSLRKLLEENDT